MSSKNTVPIPDTQIERQLEELKTVPERDPLRAASGRARFLHEAAEYRQAKSLKKEARQKKWIFPIILREKLAMNAFVALILAASMLLGGGATVAAAQNDLPNQPLYHLKLWTEDVTLAIHSDPQEQAALLMEMAQTRVEEMAALAEMDISPPDQVRDRLEQHLNRTLILAAEMDDDNREQVLLTLHDRLQTQDRLMERLQTHANKQNEPLLTRTRQMLQANLHLIDQGLADPQGFRYIMQNRMQHDQEEEVNADPNQQGEPGSHQNDGNGQPNGKPGSGSENGNSEDKHSPNGPDPDKPKSGNGAGGSDNEAPEKPKSDDHPKDGNGPGSGSGADSGNGSGEGGKN